MEASVSDVLVSVLVVLGSLLMLIAALGVLRMPDLFIRMHSATKAGTLGAILMIVAVALAFGTTSVTMRCLAIIVFLCLTAPVVAHMVGRAAYFYTGIRLWEGTSIVEVPQDPGEAE